MGSTSHEEISDDADTAASRKSIWAAAGFLCPVKVPSLPSSAQLATTPMSRLGRFLIWFWIGVAIWMSERWAWTLPALIGVVVGVWIARAQREHYRKRKQGLPPFELGSLLILVSFAYLYSFFLMFQGGEEGLRSRVGLALGCVTLSLVLLAVGAVTIGKRKVPGWLSKVWDRLLEER